MRNFYYVGISSNKIDDNSLRYVYKVDYGTRMAHWGTYKELREKNEKPRKFALKYAKELAWCLRLNGYDAFVITTTIDYR